MARARSYPLAALLVIGILTIYDAAQAAGFWRWEQSASGLGLSYAGSAALAENAASLYYNPASSALLQNTQFSLGRVRTMPKTKFHHSSGSSGDNISRDQIRANAALSVRLSDKLTLGLTSSSPIGFASEYSSSWPGAGQVIRARLDSKNFSPSLALQASDKLALGLGMNYQRTELEVASSSFQRDASGAAWGWHLGMLYSLSPKMRVGLAYRSSMVHKLDGRASYAASDVKVDLKSPAMLIWSVHQQIDQRWEAMGDISYTRWKDAYTLHWYRTDTGAKLATQELGYQNSWRVAWGTRYTVDADWRIKFGLAYEQSPSRQSANALLAEGRRYWFSLGVQYRAFGKGIMDIGFSYRRDQDSSLQQGVNDATVSGDYNTGQYLLGVQYSQSF